MADLLIKGMKMPIEGEAVVLVLSKENGIMMAEVDEYCGAVYEAVPISPHGRLIDADRALVRMWNALYALEDKREEQHGLDLMERANIQDGFEAGQRVVADAPTVIEASEGGEQHGKL